MNELRRCFGLVRVSEQTLEHPLMGRGEIHAHEEVTVRRLIYHRYWGRTLRKESIAMAQEKSGVYSHTHIFISNEAAQGEKKVRCCFSK